MKIIAAAICLAFYVAGTSPSFAKEQRMPVLVELFTSEGCNDCPPANELLTELSKQQSVPGAYVVALGEHVDYFNNPWVDPFSSARFTARQNAYAQQFHLDEVYTPEMVVDGRSEFIGSNADDAGRAVADAARLHHAEVDVSAAPGSDPGSVSVRVHVAGLSDASGEPFVFVAITEDSLVSHVKRGENAGATLHHSGVVRTLERIGAVRGESADIVHAVKIDPRWNRPNLHAVAFVQDLRSGAILGTGLTDL